jgi:hypothetical protein
MKITLIFILIIILSLAVDAQFNSGSTGVDGALDLSTCPTITCEVQLPESGILNYTTVNIPQGKELRFKLNSRNTPVIVLAQGTISIAGIVNVSGGLNGSTSTGGPGGFFGGGGSNPQTGQGYGPGGGQNGIDNNNGRWVGSLSLVPIIGGSGGATNGNIGGLGGGGAIVLASTSSVIISGELRANSTDYPSACCNGSGGAIRIVSNSITITGTLKAVSYGSNNSGIIRLEAPAAQRNFSGTAMPTPVFAEINPVIIPSNPPTLTIASIGGYTVPSYSAGRPDRVDLMLPSQLTDPLNVIIQGSNVPSGTQVQLQLSGTSGTAMGCTLTGGPGPVSCTATVSGLNRNSVSTLLAVAVFTPPALAQGFNPKGENQVAKVRLEMPLGGNPKYSFLRADGSAIEAKKLSPQFLQQFGM